LDFEIIDCNTVFGPWPAARAEMPVERLIKALNSHKVSKAFALSTIGILHNHGDGNAETIKQCQGNSKLILAATIDPRGYFGINGMIGKLKEQGFKMMRFFPDIQEWNLDNIVFGDILEENESVGMPFMVQAGGTGTPTRLARNLSNRNTKILLEGVSFEDMAEAISVLKKYDNVLIETSNMRVPGALRFLVDKIGADRVVFGSYCLRNSQGASLSYITDSDLNDENKAKILGENIKRLLGE
jgi:predicted TIM-barrel fold metal-dependent hydrolase